MKPESPTTQPPSLLQALLSGAGMVVVVLGIASHVSWQAPSGNTPQKPMQFTIVTQPILDVDHVKVVKYRIQSGDRFYATVNHGQGHTSAASNLERRGKLHTIEITVMLDHIDSHDCVKELLMVGAAGGPSIEPVKADYVLKNHIRLNNVDSTFSRKKSVELLQWNGRSYSLCIK